MNLSNQVHLALLHHREEEILFPLRDILVLPYTLTSVSCGM